MVKVKGLDLGFRLAHLGIEDNVLWFKAPVTQKQADDANAKNKFVAQRMMQSERPDDREQAMRIMAMEDAAPKDGVPWTLRKAVIQAMAALAYPDAEIDKETKKPKVETPEDVARMGYLAIAFSRAPQKPGAYVSISEDDVQLIRRKMRELGPQQMIPAVRALANEALDAAEGADVRTRRMVDFGVDEDEPASVPADPDKAA
jgi:hypothetical protein